MSYVERTAKPVFLALSVKHARLAWMTLRERSSREAEQTAAEQDRTASDADQSAADRDQTASDADSTTAESDQLASDLEQRASDREQLVSDREQLASDHEQEVSDRAVDEGETRQAARDEATAERCEATAERYEATAERAEATDERRISSEERAAAADARADTAAERNATGQLRDLNAEGRDRAAEARDQAAAILDEQFHSGSGSAGAKRDYLGELRQRAALDRIKAAADRWWAAQDRERAAHERQQAHVEIERARLDDLTGVYRRNSGTTAIHREINRARRSGRPLALALVDVDQLKAVNDRAGHAAGDALLTEVVVALRAGLRSYDPIVRLGGDEFACALGDATLEEASRRFDQIRADVKRRGGSISVGLSELKTNDTLETLLARGDSDLYQRKGREPRPAAHLTRSPVLVPGQSSEVRASRSPLG